MKLEVIRKTNAKRVPSFWWDFEWKNNAISGVIVESNDVLHPIVARVDTPEAALTLIDDLNAGRVSHRRLS